MSLEFRRAADRHETSTPGVVSRHCFSAGPYYDPANVSFGPLIAVDEHLVAPDAGFPKHAHRGVDIVSWVLDGVLRHEDSSGRERLVHPGEVQVQTTGAGIEHVEWNAGDAPLRFVQMTLLGRPTEVEYARTWPPYRLEAGEFSVHTGGVIQLRGTAHLFVGRGAFTADGQPMEQGDSLRADESVTIDGDGELLIWLF
jgi:quercetin 2,3-dioxygenase